MYWLLDYAEQENLRQRMIHLQSTILNRQPRDQSEQIFPFIGRKSRTIARTLIENLTDENATIADPFGGSGTFAYAALDAGRRVLFNEWEPYAYKMSTAPFLGVPAPDEYSAALHFIAQQVEPTMATIYKTKCPNCGTELPFDGLFFDREPLEYYHPRHHERLGAHGENVIFRDRRYRCHCGCKEKHYDDFDEAVRIQVDSMPCDFPNVELIENSRLNFTAPQYTVYQNLFSKRQQIALMTLSSFNKSTQKHNNSMDCQPYAKHRFRQNGAVFLYGFWTRCPELFSSPVKRALLDVSPVAAPPIAQPGQPVKGKAAAVRRCSAPLTGCPGCATSQGATGDISSRAAPFPWIGKGRGDRVEPLSFQTAVFPRLMC